ncbi:MAG: Hsp33 family molecular chaperone HslO [Sandaracinaceae bacterium]
MTSTEGTSDRAVTGVTEDGAFRVIVARTTETARATVEGQQIEGENARNLADVVSGTVLVRLTMAPDYRVQGIVRGAGGKGTIVGDSHPDGTARGLMQRPDGLETVNLGKGALLQMMRSLYNGQVARGVVEVPETGVSGALMNYFQASEQIEGVAMVACSFDGDRVRAAGGYMVQLLPEVSRDPLEIMAARLDADFSEREAVLDQLEASPEALLSEILYGMPFAQTQDVTLGFGCQCSSVRVLNSLATLPKADIEDLMSSNEPLHITCDYCREVYELSPKDLAGLLSSN